MWPIKNVLAEQLMREIVVITIQNPNIVTVTSLFGVEVCEGKADGLALCNFDGLGREVIVGIRLRVVGRRQNSTLSNYSC